MRTIEASEKSFVHVLMDIFPLFLLNLSLTPCTPATGSYVLEQMRWQEWCNRRATPVTDMENLDEMAVFCAFGNKKRTKVPNKEDC